MKQQGSNFVTPAGMVILILVFFAGAYFQIPGLETLTAVLFLLSATAYFWSRSALRHVDVTPAETESRGFPGETQEITLTLRNDKFLPLIWLETELPLPSSGCIAPAESDASADSLRQKFVWVMPKQTLSWRQEAMGVKRGVCAYDCITLTSGDGFGLSGLSGKQELRHPMRFVVYPAVHEVTITPIINRLTELSQHSGGIYKDPTLLKTVRSYQPGDPARDINWRLLARTGELQINLHETMRMTRFCLIPDLSSFTYQTLEKQGDVEKVVTKVREDALEETLSLMASMVVEAQKQRHLCSIVLPSTDGGAPRLVIPTSRDTQVMELLTVLSELSYEGQPVSIPVLEIAERSHLLGKCFLLSYDETHRTKDPRLDAIPILMDICGSENPDALSAKEFQP